MLRRSILLLQQHPGTAPHLTRADHIGKKSPSVPVKQRYPAHSDASSGRFGAAEHGKERLGDKVRRAVTDERERVAAAKRLTWSAYFGRIRQFPIVPFVVFMAGWTLLGSHGVLPWRGYRPGEYPPAFPKLPPELQAQVKRVPHWAPLGGTKTKKDDA